MGNIIAKVAHPAHIHDSVGVELLCNELKNTSLRPKTILANGGYEGD